MPRTSQLAVLLGLFVLAGLAFPSVADAQRRGGGGQQRRRRRDGAGRRSGGARWRGKRREPRGGPEGVSSLSYYSRSYYSGADYSGYYRTTIRRGRSA